MQKKNSRIIILLIGVFLIVTSVLTFWYFSIEDKFTLEANLLIGKEMNIGDFQKNGFQNNQILIDDTHKVWAIYLLSTCEACEDELQYAEQLYNDSASEVKIVGIMAEDENVVEIFVKKHNINFPILFDKDRNFAKSIKLKYFPSNFIVNDGKIEKVIFGSPQDKTKLSEFVK